MVYSISAWFEHIYFSQNRTFSGHARLFSAWRLLQPIFFLFVFSLTKWERPDVCQEKITCLYVQLFFCSRTDLFFLYVCHNHASLLALNGDLVGWRCLTTKLRASPSHKGSVICVNLNYNFLYSTFCSCGKLNQANPQIPPSVETYKCATLIGCWA